MYTPRSLSEHPRHRQLAKLIENATKRSKASKRKCTLDDDWVRWALTQDICPLTGLRIDWSDRRSRSAPGPLAPSIDRIEPLEGYTPENTRIVCHFANIAKSVWTDAEFTLLVLASAKNIG